MKIGVISDTHLSSNNCRLPEALINGLKGCELILHAGDLVDLCVIAELGKICKVEAVSGNMDSYGVGDKLPLKKVLDVSGKKICLMHGYGHPKNLIGLLKEEFFKEHPDIIVFGHSHMPFNEYIEGVLFFNPGSPTDTVFAPYNSYGIIDIQEGNIKSDIIKL